MDGGWSVSDSGKIRSVHEEGEFVVHIGYELCWNCGRDSKQMRGHLVIDSVVFTLAAVCCNHLLRSLSVLQA